MPQNFTGSKYEATKHLPGKDLPKLVRADLKAAFPRFKFSVRRRTFSGGSSIDVVIVRAPGLIVGPVIAKDSEAQLVLFRCKGIIEAYNYDHGDIMSDYFNVRFYSDVKFCDVLRTADVYPVRVPRPSTEVRYCESCANRMPGEHKKACRL
jgi:hypothetical protein